MNLWISSSDFGTCSGFCMKVCWEKFARYFEVELKEVKLSDGYYVMDPVKAVEMVDENTICVAAILGSTLNGEFEDVKLLNDLLTAKNKETGLVHSRALASLQSSTPLDSIRLKLLQLGSSEYFLLMRKTLSVIYMLRLVHRWETPIHVDAASGGFIAPFLYPELQWDFRLPLVKSINVSGHKYGLVYAGIGWVIWRSKEDLPEELIFHINYLGADQPTFTLNFSKGDVIRKHRKHRHNVHIYARSSSEMFDGPAVAVYVLQVLVRSLLSIISSFDWV